jgi:hypothetical protein
MLRECHVPLSRRLYIRDPPTPAFASSFRPNPSSPPTYIPFTLQELHMPSDSFDSDVEKGLVMPGRALTLPLRPNTFASCSDPSMAVGTKGGAPSTSGLEKGSKNSAPTAVLEKPMPPLVFRVPQRRSGTHKTIQFQLWFNPYRWVVLPVPPKES